jgi:hypothetical protein
MRLANLFIEIVILFLFFTIPFGTRMNPHLERRLFEIAIPKLIYPDNLLERGVDYHLLSKDCDCHAH